MLHTTWHLTLKNLWQIVFVMIYYIIMVCWLGNHICSFNWHIFPTLPFKDLQCQRIFILYVVFLLYTVCMSGQLFWTERQFYSKDFKIISVSFKIAIVRTKISSDKHVSLSFSLVMVFKKEEKIDGFFCFWLNSPHHMPVLAYLSF